MNTTQVKVAVCDVINVRPMPEALLTHLLLLVDLC